MDNLITLGGVEIGDLILTRADDKEVSSRPSSQTIVSSTPIKNVVALPSYKFIVLSVSENLVMVT